MFETVVIIGVGLLGGSLARDIRQHGLAERIIGVCRSEKTAQSALQLGLLDEVMLAEKAVAKADLIVLATPMQAMLPILLEIQSEIPKSAILTDVGSVKTDLYEDLKDRIPDLLQQFVLAHPIAGGEDSGVQASQAGLFKSKHVIVTQTPEVNSARTNKVIDLWQAVGARVEKMSLEQHDAIFAKTSHLPHVIAFALVNYLSRQNNREQLFDLAAAGFYDFTRIASSNAEMWRDICITNSAQLIHALDGFSAQIAELKSHISDADQAEILSYFDEAKVARDSGLLRKVEARQKE